MISYKIELNSNPVKGTKDYKLMLRITYMKEHVRITLDYAVKKNQFNPKPSQNQYIRQNNPKYALINNYLDNKIEEAKEAARQLQKENKLISARSIRQRLLTSKSESFYEFSEQVVQQLKKNNRIGNYKKYKSLIEKMKEYTKQEDLTFQEIDVKFLNNFQAHLASKGNAQSTITGNLRTIRALIYRSINEGLIEQGKNPFFSFKMKFGKVDRVRLNEQEILAIENLDLPYGQLIWHVRNVFMFSYYTAGMRISDVLMLKWHNIQNGRLIYRMHKTEKLHSLKLTEKAKSILSFYDQKNPDHYIFPFFNPEVDYSEAYFQYNQLSAKTAIINKYLKLIAKKADINKKISTHTARHSFADIARKKTNNIYNLSKTLGHSDLKITEAYLASFDEEAVDSTIDDVFK